MKKFLNGLMLLCALAGILLLAYPYIGFWLNDRNQSYAIQEYDDTLQRAEEDEIQEIKAKARRYNAELQPGNISDPFTRSPEGMDQEYNSLLRVGDHEVMCYLDIPRINLHLPVYHGTGEDTLQKGVGHLQGSALPVGGTGTHSILTGHTGVKSAVLFTNLPELETGDEFYIHVLDEILAYRIDDIKVIEPTDTDALEMDQHKDYVTLITCTPYGINSHRLLVRGERMPYSKTEVIERMQETTGIVDWMTLVLIIVIGSFGIILVVIAVRHRRNRKRQQ